MAVGYFILPRVGTGAETDPYRPKYLHDQNDPTMRRQEVDWYEAGETIERPAGSGNLYFAVKIGAAEADLTTLENQSDAYRLLPRDLVDALNVAGLLPVDLSAKEWGIVLGHFTRRPLEDTEP